MKFSKIICFIFTFLILVNISYAEENKKEQENPKEQRFIQTALFSYENDSVYGPDKHYTNGLQLLFVTKDFETTKENKFLTKLFDVKNKSYHNYSFGIGQKIFTPSDIEVEEIMMKDRPYAGYLYLFLNKNIRQNNRMDSIGINLGVIGPASLAEEVQKKVHELIGSPKPIGWDNQISNKILFMLIHTTSFDLNNPKPYTFDWNIIPAITSNIGTPYTRFNPSIEFRYGWNLNHDLIPNKIQSSSLGIKRNSVNSKFKDISYYAFASGDLNIVFYDAFLDGDTDIKSEWFRYEFTAGLTLRVKNFYVKYSNIFLSKEFKEQEDSQVIFLLTTGFLF